jgi:hypothetical protein
MTSMKARQVALSFGVENHLMVERSGKPTATSGKK